MLLHDILIPFFGSRITIKRTEDELVRSVSSSGEMENHMKKAVDKTTHFLMVIGCVIFAITLLIVVVNVLTRKFANYPIKGSTELVQYGIMLAVGLAMARTGFEGRHIFVPLLIDKFGLVGRQVFVTIGAAFGTCTFAVLGYLFFSDIPTFLFGASRTTDSWNIPYYAIYAIMGIGFAIATLEYLFEFGLNIALIVKKNVPAPDTSTSPEPNGGDF